MIADATSAVKLSRGFLTVVVKDSGSSETVKAALERWYKKQAVRQFQEVFSLCCPLFEKQGFARPVLKIRTMKTRWGSLSGKGNLTLNTKLICAPRECIRYVLIHELCHLAHKNHGAGFYAMLDRMMPEWKQHKSRLELSLI